MVCNVDRSGYTNRKGQCWVDTDTYDLWEIKEKLNGPCTSCGLMESLWVSIVLLKFWV